MQLRILKALTKAVAAVLVAGGLGAIPVSAKDLARLRVAFVPDRPGISTTILIRYEIGSTDRRLPSPVTDINLHLPAGLEGTANLGMAICHPGKLEELGVVGCPQNATMGRGRALVAVPMGPVIIYEPVFITAFMGPPQSGHTVMLFYAEGYSPVAADLVLPGQIIPDGGPFGERLDTIVPLTQGLPEGPDASLIRMQAEIGANHILYQKRENGKVVLFQPEGPVIPKRCPRGGFPFAATISFLDGSRVTANARVPCAGH
jgi:hypothetical protein